MHRKFAMNEIIKSKESRSARQVEKKNCMRVRQSSEEHDNQHPPVLETRKETLSVGV